MMEHLEQYEVRARRQRRMDTVTHIYTAKKRLSELEDTLLAAQNNTPDNSVADALQEAINAIAGVDLWMQEALRLTGTLLGGTEAE